MSGNGRPAGLFAGLRTSGRGRSALWKAGLTLAVLAALLAFLPRDTLVAALQRAPAPLWAAALLGLLAGHLVAAQKWRLLLRACGLRCTPVEALQAHGAGLFANLCLPSLVGGDVVRAGLIAGGGRSLTRIAVGSLADRLIDVAALGVLAALGAALVPGMLPAPTLPLLAGLGAGLVLGVALVPSALAALRPEWVPRAARGTLAQLKVAVGELRAHPGAALLAAGLSVLIQSGFVGLNAALGSALGIEVPLPVWFLVWPLAKLFALVPISLGGLGVREAALAGLLAGFGVEPVLAVAQSLLWQAALIVLGLVCGAAAFGSRRLTSRAPAGEAV